jgi:hypothetical protein
MKIVLYSDEKYEYQAKSLIQSINLNVKEEVQIIYYTLGFESSLNQPNLTKRLFPLNSKIKRFEFYKASVLLDAIEVFGGDIMFLDTDIIIGKRFSMSKLKNKTNHPLLSMGNWEYPFVCKFINGEPINNCDESNLMDYLGVKERTMGYVYTCIISLNDECVDIVREWKSVCENEYLQYYSDKYFPFPDETALNVILWKRNVNNNLGRVYLNTLEFEPLKYIEENENISGDNKINKGIMNSDLMRCDNSSDVMFYHGIKDATELEKTINYYKVN